jgi:hypothetical protein
VRELSRGSYNWLRLKGFTGRNKITLGAAVVSAVGVRKRGDAEDIYRQLESVAKTGRLAGQLASVLKNLLPKVPAT